MHFPYLFHAGGDQVLVMFWQNFIPQFYNLSLISHIWSRLPPGDVSWQPADQWKVEVGFAALFFSPSQ